MNYSIGNSGGPGKPKKRKGPITPEQAGKDSARERMKKFDNPADKKRVETTMNINKNSKKMIEKGLELNEHGIPKGGQKKKPFRLGKSTLAPKFRK